MTTKRLITLADTHDIYSRGIECVLSDSETYTVANCVCCTEALYSTLDKQPVDILILSTTLNDDPLSTIMENMKGRHPFVKVVLIALSSDINYIQKALNLGVDAYLLRSMEPDELLKALDRVASGEKYFSPEIQTAISDKVNHLLQEKRLLRPFLDITKREKEVLNLIVDGYTNHEIGHLLAISPRTVETHRANLMQKLHVRNTAGLVKMAYVLDNGV